MIQNPDEVTRLTINDTQLTTLPSEIRILANLKIISLIKNQLATLPPEMGNLTNLNHIHLQYNKLTNDSFNNEILKALSNLKQLRAIMLSGNQISPEKLEEIRRALPNTEVTF